MEMSLPRFAVAGLFWNGSRWKTLGRAGKLGHLQGSRAAPSFGRRAAARGYDERTETCNAVYLFRAGEYTDLSKTSEMRELN